MTSQPATDLTYSDVFMVPARSAVGSRLDVDLTARDGSGATIPLVAANMTAVSGRRMAETIARRGGLAILPQDIPADVRGRRRRLGEDPRPGRRHRDHAGPADTVGEALALLPKRAHGAVVVVDAGGAPVGVVTEADCAGADRFAQLADGHVRRPVHAAGRHAAGARRSTCCTPGGTGWRRSCPRPASCVGILTRTGALRATLYSPAVDAARAAAGRRRGRGQRRRRGQGQAAARRGGRRPGGRHRARAPGEDAGGAARGAGAVARRSRSWPGTW